MSAKKKKAGLWKAALAAAKKQKPPAAPPGAAARVAALVRARAGLAKAAAPAAATATPTDLNLLAHQIECVVDYRIMELFSHALPDANSHAFIPRLDITVRVAPLPNPDLASLRIYANPIVRLPGTPATWAADPAAVAGWTLLRTVRVGMGRVLMATDEVVAEVSAELVAGVISNLPVFVDLHRRATDDPGMRSLQRPRVREPGFMGASLAGRLWTPTMAPGLPWTAGIKSARAAADSWTVLTDPIAPARPKAPKGQPK